MRSLTDALLTTDPTQRARLSQALLAFALMGAGVLAMHYFVWVGVVQGPWVGLWTVCSVAGIAVSYVLIRSGWSRRFADPSLTAPQMIYAITCCAAAYAMLGPGRGGVFPIVMVILMFGMFIATPRQMSGVSLYAVVVFGLVMVAMAMLRPAVYAPAIELGHFIMVATMMPAVSILAARLARMRLRQREQKQELAGALARIRELATRDELTGLVNHRHLQELMEQEHQRCIRSGHTFCIALLAIDRHDELAAAVGTDELLRAVAQESQRWVRVADVLGRWGPDRFALLMSDTRAQLARGGLERLRERVAAAPLAALGGLQVTLSAGLAEHHAGETVDHTMARAEAALAETHGAGRGRMLTA